MSESARRHSRYLFWIPLSISIILGSCSASMAVSIGSDGSGTVAIDSRIPDAVAERLLSYRSAGSGELQDSDSLFSVQAIREGTAAKGISAIAADTPSPHSFQGRFFIRSIPDFSKDPELSPTGLIRLEASEGLSTLRFSLSRNNAEALFALFPGVDPYMLEALSPPALDPYPVSEAEYREMLSALLGGQALKDIDAARVQVQIRTPGPISRSEGGTASDRTFSVELRLLDLLVLERPIDFSVSWK